MRGTAWRRSGANVVCDKRLAGGQGILSTWFGLDSCFEAGLDPVEDWAENTKGRERGVEVKGNDEVGCRWVGDSI